NLESGTRDGTIDFELCFCRRVATNGSVPQEVVPAIHDLESGTRDGPGDFEFGLGRAGASDGSVAEEVVVAVHDGESSTRDGACDFQKKTRFDSGKGAMSCARLDHETTSHGVTLHLHVTSVGTTDIKT